MKPQILTMLELQNAMNQKVHPDWRQQNFAWHRAMWVECAELMEHYGWKWWKKQNPDRNQVILELVDIWHFGLSVLMQQDSDMDSLAEAIADDLLQPLSGQPDFKDEVEQFVAEVLATRSFPVRRFNQLLAAAELPFLQLFSLYIGKNMLNFFRQDHGYKIGTYQKIWQGREDNEHLMEILDSLDPNAADYKDQVYAALGRRYADTATF